MRISDWSSDVCSSDLSWAWTGDIRRSSLSWIVRSCPANFFFLACRNERIAGRTERRPTRSGLSAVMSGAQFPKIEPVLGYDDRFLMRVKNRKSVVSGKSVSVRLDLGGRRIIKKKTNKSR